ncbi:MAG: Molybdopterin oxidoreductase, iron-sulfur binding subunit [Labilithrix sp.]|nr:Molybdopterin oxidoreductase, iron-sulfur binding subunit [Labilithrix sp.]
MSRRQPHVFTPPADGAKVFWKSLADKDRPDLVQKRAEVEVAATAAAEGATLVKLRRDKGGKSADATDASIGRRGFMFFAGSAAALAAEGCARRPVEKIMPYAKAPEHVLPGVSNHYATVFPYRNDAIGLIVESHEGRPTKIEGNPDHPSSLGATGAWEQAAIYDMYDPDRSTTPMRGGATPSTAGGSSHQPATWPELDAVLAEIARTAATDGGAKLRILAAPSTSPTFLRLRDQLLQKLPKAQVHTWTSVNDSNAREGARLAFGQVVNVLPDYSQAAIILSLDSDFLGTEAGHVRANREFIAGRKLANGANDPMSRLYVVEPTFTTTGMNADHRLRLPAQEVERYLLALARELDTKHGVDLGQLRDAAGKADASAIPARWIAVVAKELAGARAKSVLVAGTRQPARVHALVHALNAALGNAGHTVNYYPVAEPAGVDPVASLKQLVDDMAKSAVGSLVILGGNPVYDAPADLHFGDRLRALGSSVHIASHFNETSEACRWHAPRTHELEAWGDLRSIDGTVAIQQPLIAPLFNGKSDIEVLAKLAGDIAPKGFDLVQATLRGSISSPGAMTRTWAEGLRKGVLGPAAKPFGPMDARKGEVAAALTAAAKPAALSGDNLEVTFAACGKLFDGRHANNPLLLELPDTVNKITWDNVAAISKATAQALGVSNGDVIRLTRNGGAGTPVDIAVWITPGQADNSLGVQLGWGRQKAGRYGDKRGFDVGGLRTTDAMWIVSGVKAAKLGAGELDAIKNKLRNVGMAAAESPVAGRIRPNDPFEVDTHAYKISQTQEHDTMEGRPVAIDATLDEYKKQAFFPLFPDAERKDLDQHGKVIDVRAAGSPDPATPPLWDTVDYTKGHRWGMSIDLTSCTGCNSCVIACQVENNVPAVGKEMVWRGREMHWLRIDRYFVGLDTNDPQIVFQPVACVHCEEAPCENVCPVNATEHSPEGLNDMAYNRCIGTRYCANNCPYKVRRFNFLNYHTSGDTYDGVPEVEKMHYNPNVTVRMRGVMEKCTYCVQRIQEGKIKSKRTGVPLKDGDIVSACHQACPTNAIFFGDLNDPESRVAKLHDKDRSYRLLSELGTRPRTTYLGKIRNLNPEMKEGA